MIARDIFPEHPDRDSFSEPDERPDWKAMTGYTEDELTEIWIAEQERTRKRLHQHDCGHDCTGSACLIYGFINSECLGCQRRRCGL